VQALPDRLLLPIFSALRTLAECFGRRCCSGVAAVF